MTISRARILRMARPTGYKRRRSTPAPTIVFAVLLATASQATPSAQDRIELSAAGISLNQPAGWHIATLEQVQTNRRQARLPDPELQSAHANRSALPIVALTKYAEPHRGLNP